MVLPEVAVLLVFPIEAGTYLLVGTRITVHAGIEKYFKSYRRSTNFSISILKAYQNYETRYSIITSKIRYVYENSSPGYDVILKRAPSNLDLLDR